MKAKPFQIEALKPQIQKNFKAALLYGPDLSVAEDCAKQIIRFVLPHLDDFSLIKVMKSQLKETPTLLLDEGNALSLLGNRKVIWVRDADNSTLSYLENFIDYIKSDTFLILTADNLTKTSGLKVYGEERPDILTIACYADEEKDVRFLIQNHLKEKGITVTDSVLSFLTERMNENRQATKNELEKLITYLGDKKTVERADVEAIIADTATATADMLCFAVSGGQQKEADKSLQTLLANGENPVSIVRILMMHFNKLLWGADLLSRRVGSDEICRKLLRANQFKLKEEMMRQVYIWKKEPIIKTLQLLTETEIQTKTTGMPAELILERTVTMITGLGKKLARR